MGMWENRLTDKLHDQPNQMTFHSHPKKKQQKNRWPCLLDKI